MKKILFLMLCFSTGYVTSFAHDHQHNYFSKMEEWHTKAIAPFIGKIGVEKLSPSKVFSSITQTVSAQGAHLQEVYAALGVDTVKHLDILALYTSRTGKPFQQNEIVLKYLQELNKARASKQYTADAAEDFYKMRINVYDTIKDSVIAAELNSMIMLFEISGTYWDIALNDYPLAPKSKNAIRRENFDAINFSNYYMALRELGLNHDFACTIASIETAYDALFCKNCGVW